MINKTSKKIKISSQETSSYSKKGNLRGVLNLKNQELSTQNEINSRSDSFFKNKDFYNNTFDFSQNEDNERMDELLFGNRNRTPEKSNESEKRSRSNLSTESINDSKKKFINFFSSSKKIKKSSKFDFLNYKQENLRNVPNNKNVFRMKRILAILKNWNEVCKTIPQALQFSFKQRLLGYAHKKINPFLIYSGYGSYDNFDNFEQNNEDEVVEIFHQPQQDKSSKSNQIEENFSDHSLENEEKGSYFPENNQNLFWENEVFNMDQENLFDCRENGFNFQTTTEEKFFS